MPTFFAFYGLTWTGKNKHFDAAYCRKKCTRLLIPYLFWAVAYSLVTQFTFGTWSVKSLLFILYGSQTTLKAAGSLTSLWFITCMFVASVFFDVMMKTIEGIRDKERRGAVRTAVLIGTAVGGYICSFIHIGYGFPWSIDVALTAVFFMQIGYYCGKFFRSRAMTRKRQCCLCGTAFVLLTATFRLNISFLTLNNVDMASGTYGLFPLFLLTASAGILFLLTIAQLLVAHCSSKLLSLIGENTLTVLFLHKPIVKAATVQDGMPTLIRLVLAVVLSALVTCFAAVCTIPLTKYTPWIIGKEKTSKHEKTVDSCGL